MQKAVMGIQIFAGLTAVAVAVHYFLTYSKDKKEAKELQEKNRALLIEALAKIERRVAFTQAAATEVMPADETATMPEMTDIDMTDVLM